VLVGVTGVAVFVAVTVAQHAVAPQLNPGQHTISEYANARAGWLMTAAFAAWSVSLAATAALAHRAGRSLAATVAHRRFWWDVLMLGLAVASAGLLVTAAFKTQTSAGALPTGVTRSLGGRLHDYGSAGALLALFMGVFASARLTGAPFWFRRAALRALAVAVAADVGLLVVGDPAPGLRQRLLAILAIVWHAALLAVLRRLVQRWPSAAARSAEATDQLRIMSR
jgi:hypothetical protein